MTDLFRQLDHEWPRYARSREARLDFAMWSRRDPNVAVFGSPAAILDHVRSTRIGTESVLASVAERAKTDGTARRLALQIMVPGLAAAAPRNRFHPDFDDIAARLVEFALGRLATWNPDRPVSFAVGIVVEARRSLHLDRRAERVERAARGDRVEFDYRVDQCDPRPLVESLPTVLDDAVERSSVSRFDADVILLTRVLGVPISHVAAELGVNYGSLRRRRTRAERLIAPHLIGVA